MQFSDSYILPFVLSTALHALVITAMMVNWESEPTIDLVPDQPYYIEASIVRENPHEVKKREQERAAARAKAARQKEIEAKRAADLRKQQEQKQEPEPEPSEVKVDIPEIASIPELQQLESDNQETDEKQEAERKRMEQQLVMEIMEEQEARRAITADEKAMAYVAQIKRDIAQNWSRPPSARRDMEALLRVRLVPTGEVVAVSVAKSSGNSAFDRSAVLAVEKADRFQVPDDSRQFERNFREFNVLFRPEDLRL